MEYSIVTNYKINKIIEKNSKYYQISLGLSSTSVDMTGERQINRKDTFAYFYYQRYNVYPMGQGKIGNIKFYTDHYIKLDQIAFYYDTEEFIYNLDEKIINEKGADFYLGSLIKTTEEQYAERIKEKNIKTEELKNQMGGSNKSRFGKL